MSLPNAARACFALMTLASCATVSPPRPAPRANGAPSTPLSMPRSEAAAQDAPPVPAALAPVFRLDGEPTFDIGLAWDVDSVRLELAPSMPLQWRAPNGDSQQSEAGGPVRIRLSGVQALIEPLGRSRAVPLGVLGAGDTLWIGETAATRGTSAQVGWNGKRWRGRFKVFIGPRGRLTVATRLALEAYLLGVVPGEIGALGEALLEAGRAQAIAARSYSLFYRGRRGPEGFDLYSTVEDQMYVSSEGERPLATRCVTRTHGQVAMSDGFPIRANYYSTCGGITAEAWEAWPTEQRPYLRSVLDRGAGREDHCVGSPHHRWREEWSVEAFLATVAKWAPSVGIAIPPEGLGDLVDVSIASRSRSGRVWQLRVQTTRAELIVPAHGLRQVLRRPGGTAILRSTLFKIGLKRDPRTRRVVAVVASGAGNGHGVGLCQVGAIAMARGGGSASEIIEHYYAGTTIERLYGR